MGVLSDIGKAVKNVAGGAGTPMDASDDHDRAGKPRSFETFKRGGRVKRTGLAKVHKGERVLTKRQARKYQSSKRG